MDLKEKGWIKILQISFRVNDVFNACMQGGYIQILVVGYQIYILGSENKTVNKTDKFLLSLLLNFAGRSKW